MTEVLLRRWLYGVLLALAVIVLGRVVWLGLIRVNGAIQVLIIGGVVAFVFEPVVRVLDRVFHARLASAVVLALVVLGLVGVVGGAIGIAAFRQAQSLITALPGLVNSAQAAVPQWLSFLKQAGIPFDPNTIVQQALSRFGDIGRGALTASVAVVGTVVGLITTLVIGLSIAFYILLDGRRMHAGLTRLLPPTWRPAAAESERIVLRVLGGFIRGQLLVAIIFGFLVGVGMAWLGLPYPLLLGLQAAVFELLPTIGPFLGAVTPFVLALGMPYPHALWVLAYFFGAEQLESTFLVPRISGNAVGLHPVAIIAGIVAGFEVDGIVGALAAVPLMGVVWALLRRYAAPWSLEPARGRGGRPPRGRR